MASAYEICKASSINDTTDKVLECVANELQGGDGATVIDVNTWFVILSATIMFFMQAGFAVLCAGSVRLKNVQNTLLKNVLDACGAAVGFFTIGYAFAYGGESTNLNATTVTFIGNRNFFLVGVDDYAFWFFQFAFAATAATIVAGTLAERCQMGAYLAYSILLTGFVYPVVVHACWSTQGFLSPYRQSPLWGSGLIDFAGSTVVHTTGGMTSLIAAKILGPRKNRFYDSRGIEIIPPARIQGHSVPLQVLGALILWFGWFGFNAGSSLHFAGSSYRGFTASLAAVNTALGGAFGCVVTLIAYAIISERRDGEALFDIFFALNGMLSGLVSITAGCGVMEPWAACVTGCVAGVVYLIASNLLEHFKIDDAVDAIPVHFANGVWGTIAVGLFTSPRLLHEAYGTSTHSGLFYGSGGVLLGAQIMGLLFTIAWVTVIMTPFFLVLNYLGWFRADPLEEIVGLDISYHGADVLKRQRGENEDDTELASAMEAIEKRRTA